MQPPRPLTPAALLLLLGALAGCLDVSPAGTAFVSDPPGARVLVDGRDSGWVTPCQFALDVEETYVVSFALPGYAPREVLLVPDTRRALIDWYQGVNGVKSATRFPILMPVDDFLFPLRTVQTLAPGRVFVRLRPQDS